MIIHLKIKFKLRGVTKPSNSLKFYMSLKLRNRMHSARGKKAIDTKNLTSSKGSI